MTFGNYGRASGIPRLYTHADALTRLESTKPIRGRSELKYPLGRRNGVDSYSIRKADNGDIECVLYGYTVVTYHQDNTLTVHCAATSKMSMANFIGDLLGLRAYQHDYKLEIRTHNKSYALARGESLKLSADRVEPYGYAMFTAVGAPTKYVHKLKRREANIVRSRYAEMQNYISGMVKVRDCMFSSEDLTNAFGLKTHTYERQDGTQGSWTSPDVPTIHRNNPEDMEKLFGWYESGEPEQMNKCVLWLAQNSLHRYFLSPSPIYLPNVLAMLDMCILARHKHEVMEKVEVPEGVVKKDRYSWAW